MVWDSETDEKMCKSVKELEIVVQGGGFKIGVMGRGTEKAKLRTASIHLGPAVWPKFKNW
jgi:hypothetical protein